jgi:hypothetical protein
MGLLGKGVLAIWNGIAPEAEEDFVAWHVREHIPERVALSGFLRGRRYVALDGFPKYFNFYETTTADDLSSAAYRARLDAPTDWTRKVVAQFRDTLRRSSEFWYGRRRDGRGAAPVGRPALPDVRSADGSTYAPTARGAGHCRRAPAARSVGRERRCHGREDIARSAGSGRRLDSSDRGGRLECPVRVAQQRLRRCRSHRGRCRPDHCARLLSIAIRSEQTRTRAERSVTAWLGRSRRPMSSGVRGAEPARPVQTQRPQGRQFAGGRGHGGREVTDPLIRQRPR